MRVIIQRVLASSVRVNSEIVGEIQKGLLVLVGFEESDNIEDIEWISKKIIQLRIFNDQNNIMNLSLTDIKGDILLVSQFTLHASTKKGNRPSYIKAAKPNMAIPLYENLIKQISSDLGKEIQTGIFGAMMEISLINDGPVTIFIDTKNKE
ncbi:MAG TPA: D-aminoacyl-tRNA deacylase [Bacteroidales bacterium]|nr:D-aminoacyl-tRNA deacylase [Bacteroidales bacterium]